MIKIRSTAVTLLLMFALTAFGASATANASPPPWNDALHAQAAGAEGLANNWAGSVGRSGPAGWKHVYHMREVTCPPPPVVQLAWFCPAQRIVDVTPNAIISWNGAGPAGVHYLMGHEATHAFGANENQASCGGGVFLRWLGTPGGDAERVFIAIRGGSGNAAHGSMVAMSDAARNGYNAGHLGACGL